MKVTTVADWAKETGGGGRGTGGRSLPNPVKVEVVTQDCWNAAGFKKADDEPAVQRMRLPVLRVCVVPCFCIHVHTYTGD